MKANTTTKVALLAIIAAAAVFLGFAPEAQAGSGYYRYSNPTQCYRVYRTHTSEINRYRECRIGYRPCGQRFSYHVTIVTYRDYYSNGSFRTYTRVFS